MGINDSVFSGGKGFILTMWDVNEHAINGSYGEAWVLY